MPTTNNVNKSDRKSIIPTQGDRSNPSRVLRNNKKHTYTCYTSWKFSKTEMGTYKHRAGEHDREDQSIIGNIDQKIFRLSSGVLSLLVVLNLRTHSPHESLIYSRLRRTGVYISKQTGCHFLT